MGGQYEYVNGDGKNRPIEVLTEDGVRALTGHEGTIPCGVWHAFNIKDKGNVYRVDRVLCQWPFELPGDEEIGRRLRSLQWGQDRQFNPLSVCGVLYIVLDQRKDA